MSDLLAQRYQLIEELGEGGFSHVYRAHDTLLSRKVAIKILKVNAQKDPENTQRFFTEAKITSKLNQPNTLTIYDFGQDDQGRCFLVSELLEGEPLHVRLARGPLRVESALSIIYQVGQALKMAHTNHVIHRDLKPANIFLTTPQEGPNYVKLLDFGIAKALEEQSQTMTGQMMGTPSYMSPEQIVNIKTVDSRSDIYSLGIVFFHMLSGRVPFKHKSYYEVMRQHMQDPLPLIEFREEVSGEIRQYLQDLIRKMTIKEPNKRFQKIENVTQIIKSIWHHFPETQQNQHTQETSPLPLPTLSSSSLPTSPSGKKKAPLDPSHLDIAFQLEPDLPSSPLSSLEKAKPVEEQTQNWSKSSFADTQDQYSPIKIPDALQSSNLLSSTSSQPRSSSSSTPPSSIFHDEDQVKSPITFQKESQKESQLESSTPLSESSSQKDEINEIENALHSALKTWDKDSTPDLEQQRQQEQKEYYSYLKRTKPKSHELDQEYLSQLYTKSKKDDSPAIHIDHSISTSPSSNPSEHFSLSTSPAQEPLPQVSPLPVSNPPTFSSRYSSPNLTSAASEDSIKKQENSSINEEVKGTSLEHDALTSSESSNLSSNHPSTLSRYIGTTTTPAPETTSTYIGLSSTPPLNPSSTYLTSSTSPQEHKMSSDEGTKPSNEPHSSNYQNVNQASPLPAQTAYQGTSQSTSPTSQNTSYSGSTTATTQTTTSYYSNFTLSSRPPTSKPSSTSFKRVDHEAEVFKGTRPQYVPPKRPPKKRASTSNSVSPLPASPHAPKSNESSSPSLSTSLPSSPSPSLPPSPLPSSPSSSLLKTSAPTPLPETREQTPVRIVMIDPNDFVSNLYSNGLRKKFAQHQKKTPHLQRYTLQISAYSDYKEALYLLSSSPIDLLMIEYKSNTYQILDVLKEIKAQGSLLHPIFILSNDREKNEQEETQLLQAGATLFLNKPLTLPTLFRHILRHLHILNSL